MKDVEEFLKSDRQWKRDQRIAHAQYQIRTGNDQDFWLEVLRRLRG